MDSFTHLELNSPAPLLVSGVGHIISPRIQEIVNLRERTNGARDGEYVYNLFLSTLIRTKAQFLEAISDNFTEKQLKELDNIPLFSLYLLFGDTRHLLMEAISFFCTEYVAFDKEKMRLVLYEEISEDGAGQTVVGEISDDNYTDVRNCILQRNYVDPPASTNGKRRSKKMIAFDKKIEEGRKQSKKFKDNQKAMQLGNLVSKVASNGVGIQNVYDLTVYQLYDQFFEINTSIQIEAARTRWSVWGKDKFDFSQWYKVINEKEK